MLAKHIELSQHQIAEKGQLCIWVLSVITAWERTAKNSSVWSRRSSGCCTSSSNKARFRFQATDDIVRILHSTAFQLVPYLLATSG